MSFVIDTDICSAYLKGDPKVFNKFLQHHGAIHVSIITVGELQTWAHKSPIRPKLQQGISDLLAAAQILPVDENSAELFGRTRAGLIAVGIHVPLGDMFIASTALYHNFTAVTHNAKHFKLIPQLASAGLD